jgi:Na+/alanine symporter
MGYCDYGNFGYVFAGLVIFGGVKRIAKRIPGRVPFMASFISPFAYCCLSAISGNRRVC